MNGNAEQMTMTGRKRRRLKAWAGYAVAGAITLALVLKLFQHYAAEPGGPLQYWGDAVEWIATVNKMLLQDETRLFAPWGLAHPEHPLFRAVYYAAAPCSVWLLALLSSFTGNTFQAVAAFYGLSFFLVTFSFVFLARRLRLSFDVAIPLAVLYAFLPYHLFRGTHHLMESTYFLVPLMTLVLLRLWSKCPLFFKPAGDGGFRPAIAERRTLLVFLLAFVAGPASYYQHAFFGMLAAVSGAGAAVYRRSRKHAVAAALLFLLVALSFTKFGLPLAVLERVAPAEHADFVEARDRIRGSYTSVARYGDTELFGLKIAQLLLPVTGHRLEPLREIKEAYRDHHLTTENDFSTLGVVASFGFLVLLALLLDRRAVRPSLLHRLAILNIAGVLIGTLGGFGTLLPALLYPYVPEHFPLMLVRATNRISIFLACFSLLAAGVLLQRLRRRWLNTVRPLSFGRLSWGLLMTALLGFGLLDVVPGKPSGGAKTVTQQSDYRVDRAFFGQLEASLPPGASVFQLPFRLHHTGYLHRMQDADPLRPYLATTTLKWPYGANEGTYQLEWYRQVSRLPPDARLTALGLFGFQGLLLDRHGYDEAGWEEVTDALESRLGEPVRWSSDLRWYFFDLRPWLQQEMGTWPYEDFRAAKAEFLEAFETWHAEQKEPFSWTPPR